MEEKIRNDAENTLYVNVRILGYQDTLCANAGTQYYYKCYIAGNVDFIYGNEPRAFFNDCKLVFRYSAAKNSGYVCAPKTGADAAYGLTFYKCRVLSETGCYLFYGHIGNFVVPRADLLHQMEVARE